MLGIKAWTLGEFGDGKETELTKAIGSIYEKEKHASSNALRDRKSAIHLVGLLDGNIVQGCKCMLSTKSVSRTNCRHGFLCDCSAFGNMLKRESEIEWIYNS
jgi:hypothetical protein